MSTNHTMCWVGCLAVSVTSCVFAADWPQWRGAHRDGKVTGFTAPEVWPQDLSQKWKVEVGDGVATPALVGDCLYVFARQGDNEVTRCLDAQLVVFQPGETGFQQVASYKVAHGGTYAYPVVAGSRVYVKDSDSVTLWSIE